MTHDITVLKVKSNVLAPYYDAIYNLFHLRIWFIRQTERVYKLTGCASTVWTPEVGAWSRRSVWVDMDTEGGGALLRLENEKLRHENDDLKIRLGLMKENFDLKSKLQTSALTSDTLRESTGNCSSMFYASQSPSMWVTVVRVPLFATRGRPRTSVRFELISRVGEAKHI